MRGETFRYEGEVKCSNQVEIFGSCSARVNTSYQLISVCLANHGRHGRVLWPVLIKQRELLAGKTC